MIVQCPNCDSRYRVNDANVPASGGKITCPSCGDKFIVYPDAPDSHTQNSFEDKTSVAKAPALRELVNKMSPQRTEPDDLNAATEVMSSLDIPDSLTSDTQNIATDGTVEMASPDIAQLRDIGGRHFDGPVRSEEHTSELQSRPHLVCRLLLEKKKQTKKKD